ncbi:MAG TPA: co-chaperone GroES [Candidatus Saccharimonadales bacterium]|nr:co-chaperone GroES [Candidatus Saccharimonadales bacterium]
MSVNIKPLNDRIVAQPVQSQAKTASGLYLPDSAREKSQVAKVVAVGSSVKSVKVGDNILYREYSATEFQMDSEKYLVIKEEDILATVTNK